MNRGRLFIDDLLFFGCLYFHTVRFTYYKWKCKRVLQSSTESVKKRVRAAAFYDLSVGVIQLNKQIKHINDRAYFLFFVFQGKLNILLEKHNSIIGAFNE